MGPNPVELQVYYRGNMDKRQADTQESHVRAMAEVCGASKVTAVHVCRQTSQPSGSQP